MANLILISATEIAKCYGTNCTKFALDKHFKRNIRPNVEAIRNALDRGDDPKDLIMMQSVRDGKIGTGQMFCHIASAQITRFPYVECIAFFSSGVDILMAVTEIVKFYGSHLTKYGLASHMNRDLTSNVKLLKDAVDKGTDPKDVVLVEGVRDGKSGKGQTDYFIPFTLHILHISFCWGLHYFHFGD